MLVAGRQPASPQLVSQFQKLLFQFRQLVFLLRHFPSKILLVAVDLRELGRVVQLFLYLGQLLLQFLRLQRLHWRAEIDAGPISKSELHAADVSVACELQHFLLQGLGLPVHGLRGVAERQQMGLGDFLVKHHQDEARLLGVEAAFALKTHFAVLAHRLVDLQAV